MQAGNRTPKAEQRILRDLVWVLYTNAVAVVRVMALISAADTALERREESDETLMLRLTEWAMLTYVAVRVACMLDEAERGNACLPQVFKMLANDAIRAAVVDDSMSLTRTERERHLERAVRAWDRVSVDPRRERLRKARSHTLAHNLVDKTLNDAMAGGLAVPALGKYAEECVSIVSDLALACLGSSAIDAVRGEAPSVADRIWSRMSSLSII